MDPDVPDSLPHAHGVNIALAVLIQGLMGFNAEELDTALEDLPLLEPGGKGRISANEAAEVSHSMLYSMQLEINIIYGAAGPSSRVG